jgi:hypothetical protein
MDDHEREVAKARYEFHVAESQAAQRYQNELAKWLLASLILVNGGGLVLLANSKEAARLHDVPPAFIVGIVAAVLCGFLAWLNASVRDVHYDAYAQPESLKSGEVVKPPLSDRREWQIIWTYRLSIAAGLSSIGAFVWGACAAL